MLFRDTKETRVVVQYHSDSLFSSKSTANGIITFPKGLDDSRQVTILRKTTTFLNLQDMFRQSFCHLQLNGSQSMQS